MFRLILDIAEINIDQVKLPKVPGIGMIKRLPDDQKFAMLVNFINAQKTQFLPKLEEEASKRWGYIRISDLKAQMPSDGSCYIRLSIDVTDADYDKAIDVTDADYDKAIDAILPNIFQPKDAAAVLGEDYQGPVSTPDVISYMHETPSAARKEFYLVKTLSCEKQNIANLISTGAQSQGAILRISNIRFFLKQA